MSGGDVDVAPYLYSRNTIGHGNHNSNSQKQKSNGGTVWYVVGLPEFRWWLSKWVCGGVSGGGQKLQKCSFGRDSRMIRARSRMIRVKVRMIQAGQLRTGMARDELENGEKFEDFEDFNLISRVRWWGNAKSTCNTTNP